MLIQYGVLAYETDEKGEPRFLLITSRETKRWVIPRGNPMAGLSPAQAAAQEAYEEAGIKGEVGDEALGTYLYDKRKAGGSAVPAEVHVFAMRVREQAERWPEKEERVRQWFSREEAAEAVEESGLKALIGAALPENRDPPEAGA